MYKTTAKSFSLIKFEKNNHLFCENGIKKGRRYKNNCTISKFRIKKDAHPCLHTRNAISIDVDAFHAYNVVICINELYDLYMKTMI